MADPINIETVVDTLSKPENKGELDKALNDAFKEATTSGDNNTPAPAENKVVEKQTEGEDPSKQKAGEADKKPASRIDEILADRNEAKAEAAEKQTEVQALTKQVETLAKLVEDLKAGKTDERAGDAKNDDSTDDKPMTKKEVDEYIEKKLSEKQSVAQQSEAAEKSIVDAIQALETKPGYENSSKYSKELKQVMDAFPKMKADVAYDLLKGRGVIPNEVLNSNANRTGTGNRSKTNLLDTKKPEDMTQAEAFAHLMGEEKAGTLKGII